MFTDGDILQITEIDGIGIIHVGKINRDERKNEFYPFKVSYDWPLHKKC